MFKYALFFFVLAGFMTNTKANYFTSESQLVTRYGDDIANFWQHGHFSSFNGAKNTRINYAIFSHDEIDLEQKNSTVRKCLVISSGRSEGYLKYKELAFDLFKLGFNVSLIDHRGQGLSERALENKNKGYVEDFQYYVDDLANFIESKVYPLCDKQGEEQKPYLLAHSMGGAIAARYLQDHPDKIQAAVLSSPMFGFNSGGIPDSIAKPLINTTAKLNQWFGESPWYFFGHGDYVQSEFDGNLLTHSELRFQQFNQLYNQTPEMQLGGVTVKWLTESVSAIDKIFENIAKITTPTLVIQAGSDKVVKNEAQTEFCQALHQVHPHSCPNGKPIVIEQAYHELFFERDSYRQQALSAVKTWFDKH